ncbi:MAG: PKD repeat protein [Arenicella sp.]|jgi:PKD repeat protein
MKKLLTLVISLSVIGGAFAQDNHAFCGTDEHAEELKLEYPNAQESIEAQIARIRSNQHAGDRTVNGTIPVVVHVIHDGGTSNISYAQIESAIQQVNEDYNGTNPDFGNTRNTGTAPFAPEVGVLQLSFELAKIDPNGNCTNGVERRNNPAGAINAEDNVKSYNGGGLDGWPIDSYMNIWVVSSIEGSGQGVTLGYAQFPYFGNANTYGVVIRHDAFGTMGTANGDRTFTHELGHCLGLFHTFQDGCSSADCGNNGDYCCDTPPQSEAFWSCNQSQNSCTGVPTNDTYGFDAYDQWENFMSYSPCQYMFSADQVNIMLGNMDTYPWMDSLRGVTNGIATGVGLPAQLCKAEFSTSLTLVCAGSTIDFTDESYFSVTGRDWTFDGGTPGTSTDANPTVTYDTPGVYDVTLEVTDGSTMVTTTETEHIIVLASPGTPLPYTEGFEPYASLPDNQNWMVENESGAAWNIQPGIGSSGDQCIKLSNFGNTNGSKDEFLSGPVDLGGVDVSDNIVFNFKYAYKKRSASNDEWLRFYISNDCGATWTLRKNIHGDDLSDQTLASSYSTPADEDWTQVNITNINSAYFVDKFRFKFEFENDNGNNIYIDDINMYSGAMTNLSEENKDFNLSVYPNPTNNEFNVRIDIAEAGSYSVDLKNTLGQTIANVFTGSLQNGIKTVHYNSTDLPSGVYFLNINHEGNSQTVKLIKK